VEVKWIGHTLRRDSSPTKKQAASWKSKGQSRKKGRRRILRSWRTNEEEAERVEETRREVTEIAGNSVRFRYLVEAL
jgi:hypothetical protein